MPSDKWKTILENQLQNYFSQICIKYFWPANFLCIGLKNELLIICYSFSQNSYKNSAYWAHICAGSIINQWTVISAAHCFKGDDIDPKDFIFLVVLNYSLETKTSFDSGVKALTLNFWLQAAGGGAALEANITLFVLQSFNRNLQFCLLYHCLALSLFSISISIA